jgi:hypothetical protein
MTDKPFDADRLDLMQLVCDQRNALCEIALAVRGSREDWRLETLPQDVEKSIAEATDEVDRLRSRCEGPIHAAWLAIDEQHRTATAALAQVEMWRSVALRLRRFVDLPGVVIDGTTAWEELSDLDDVIAAQGISK